MQNTFSFACRIFSGGRIKRVLRGLRWQVAFVIVAVIVFAVALILRSRPIPAVLPSPLPASTTAASVESATVPAPLPPQNIATPTAFSEGLVGQVQRLNPLFACLNPVDRDITSLIFQGLVGTNQYGEYTPELAEEWLISGDGLEYVFRLRQDVLWQDGVPFTAADVAVTIGLLQSPGDALPEELTTFWRTVEMELLDEYTVRFRLAQPLAEFPDHLRIGILPAHVFNGIPPEQVPGHPFNLSPIGTGPYQLESLIAGEDGITAVNLRVAPVYRQRPEGQAGFALERLTFRLYPSQEAASAALNAGEILALGGVGADVVALLEQSGRVTTHIAVEPTIGVVLFNWESERTHAFRDQRTRRALIMGADRAGLVNRHLDGRAIPADSPMIPGSWAYAGPIDWPDYDPTAAAALLANIEFAIPTPEPTESEGEETPEATPAETPTPEPQPLYTFSLLSSDDPALTALAEDLVTQWSLLGIQVNVESVPPDELQARLESGQFDAALVELSLSPGADPDSYMFWHQGQYGEGQNYGGINDRRSSELLEYARRDPNGLHRAEYYAEFQHVFADRSLALLLYYPVYQYAVDTRVQNVQLGFLSTPADRFRNIQDWTLATE